MKLTTAASALNGVPSWKVIPSRKVMVHSVASSLLSIAATPLLLTVADNKAIAGNYANKMMKLQFYSGEIREDIGMIEFQIIKNNGSRMKMDKLGAFVKKRGVILIRFNDKER